MRPPIVGVPVTGASPAAYRRAKYVRGLDIRIIPFDELAVWRARAPIAVGHTAGSSTSTLSYKDHIGRIGARSPSSPTHILAELGKADEEIVRSKPDGAYT